MALPSMCDHGGEAMPERSPVQLLLVVPVERQRGFAESEAVEVAGDRAFEAV
jgi:hypothetical protein